MRLRFWHAAALAAALAGCAVPPAEKHETPQLELPATTLAAVIGHADAGFTLRVYARENRDAASVVRDVLDRAAAAGVGQ